MKNMNGKNMNGTNNFNWQMAAIASVDYLYAVGRLKDVCEETANFVDDGEPTITQNVSNIDQQIAKFLLESPTVSRDRQKARKSRRHKATFRIAKARAAADSYHFPDDESCKQIGRYKKVTQSYKKHDYDCSWMNEAPARIRRHNERVAQELREYRNGHYDPAYIEDQEWEERDRQYDEMQEIRETGAYYDEYLRKQEELECAADYEYDYDYSWDYEDDYPDYPPYDYDPDWD